MILPILLWGYFSSTHWGQCFFLIVGVGVHWLNVTTRSLYVQWVKIFKICLFGVLCFTCTVHTLLLSYILHIILSHVHLNKHTQQALYSSVNCSPCILPILLLTQITDLWPKFLRSCLLLFPIVHQFSWSC